MVVTVENAMNNWRVGTRLELLSRTYMSVATLCKSPELGGKGEDDR